MILPFIMAMTVKGKKTKVLRAYVAPVNHNVLNEDNSINIAHTMMVNFCHGNESKVLQIEQMGNDSWMIVWYHDKVSEDSELSIILFQIRILCLLHMLFLIKLFWINKRTSTFMMMAPKSEWKDWIQRTKKMTRFLWDSFHQTLLLCGSTKWFFVIAMRARFCRWNRLVTILVWLYNIMTRWVKIQSHQSFYSNSEFYVYNTCCFLSNFFESIKEHQHLWWWLQNQND